MAVVLASAMTAPGPAAAVSEDERQAEIAREVERLAERVDEAAAEEADALAELELARRAKGELDVAVVGLDQRLGDVEAELAVSERELVAAAATQRRAAGRLAMAEAQVEASERTLRDQAVSRFMRYGVEASTLDVFLHVSDVRALHDAAAFAGAVASAQAEVIHRHQRLQGETADLVARAEQATDQAARRREEVADRRQELAAVRAAQVRARGEMEAEADRESELVTTLQATQADYEARIVALEAESKAITALLRQRQAAEEAAAARTTVEGDPAPAVPDQSVTRAGDGDLRYPLASPVVTSGFGYRTHPVYGTRRLHAGIDLRGAMGTTVLAAGEGTVIFAGDRGGYGTTVIIDHGGSVATLYAHQSRLAVSEGEAVRPGQAVGAVGSTGLSTGPHLHFEVRVDGTPVDPLNYL